MVAKLHGKRREKREIERGAEALKYTIFQFSKFSRIVSQQEGSKNLFWSCPYAAISKASALPETLQIH